MFCLDVFILFLLFLFVFDRLQYYRHSYYYSFACLFQSFVLSPVMYISYVSLSVHLISRNPVVSHIYEIYGLYYSVNNLQSLLLIDCLCHAYVL